MAGTSRKATMIVRSRACLGYLDIRISSVFVLSSVFGRCAVQFSEPSIVSFNKYFTDRNLGDKMLVVIFLKTMIKNSFSSKDNFLEMAHTNFVSSIRKTPYQPLI